VVRKEEPQMDRVEQFHLTVYTAGPIETLAEILAGTLDAISVTEITGWWDTGIGVQSQEASKVEGIGDLLRVTQALYQVEAWSRESGEPPAMVEIYETFARGVSGP
jgi:hypothetical protein